MRRTWTSKDKFTYVKAIHKNNYSLTKSLRLTTSITPCPIKPTENIIPKDLNLQKIFTNMLKYSQDLSKTYFPLITKNTYANKNLNNNITMVSRITILRKIREFFLYYNIDYKIYFKTILLYDIISLENENKKLLYSNEEIALGALILSIKFNYDENKMFSMKKFLSLYGEEIYSLSKIIDIERNALKTINYFLNFTTPMCFLEFFLLNGIIYNIDYVDKSDYAKIYFEIENILQNVMEESNNYLKYNFFYLACSIVSYCRQIFNLEKWPRMLKNVFSIDFYFFQNEYNIFFEKKENNNNSSYNNKSKIYSHKTYNSNIINSNRKDIIINGNNNLVLLDLKSLKNNSSNKRNSYFNSLKKNYYKTIDHYNNIINININNVSFNNIYNNNNVNNSISNNISNNNTLIEKSKNNNIKSKRFHYNINNINSAYYSNDEQENNKCIPSLSYGNNVQAENNRNNLQNDDLVNSKYYNLTSNLTEIKEDKDINEENTYASPPKLTRKHYFIIKNENKNNIKIEENDDNEENEQKENKNNNNKIENEENQQKKDIVNNDNRKFETINNENNKNEEVIKNKLEFKSIKSKYNYIKKNYTYNYDSTNKIKNTLKEKNNIIKNNDDKYKKTRLNNNNNIYSNHNRNEEINNYKNFYRYNKTILNTLKESDINIKNGKNKDNINININTNKNEINSTSKKQNKGLISRYFNYTYFKTEKKDLDTRNNINDKVSIRNIKPNKLEFSNPKYIDEATNNTLSTKRYESSNIRQSYRRSNHNIENKNNLNKIDENTENYENTFKNEKKYIYRNINKDISINKKRHKGENKTRYNDLIKYKLSVCDSINKRKK